MERRANLAAQFLGSGWTAVASLVFIPLYVQFLGIEGWGLVGFFATFSAWALLLDLGLGAAMNREMARLAGEALPAARVRALFGAVQRFAALGALAVACAGAVLAWPLAANGLQSSTLPRAEVAGAVALMGLAVAAQWLATLYKQALLGLQHQLWISAYGAAAATLRGLGAVAVLGWISPTIEAYLVFQALAGCVETVVLRRALQQRMPGPEVAHMPWREAVAALRPFCAGVAATTLLATLLTQADKLLLAQLVPLAQFGLFMLGVAVAQGLAVVVVPVQNVAYPRLSELAARGDERRARDEYHALSQLLSVLLLPPAAMLCLFPRDVLFAWTGNPATADGAAALLAVYALGTALNGLMHMPHVAQLAHGWPRLAAVQNMVAVVLVLPALLWAVPRHGAIAAAWIWVALNAGFLVFGTHAMHRRILQGEQGTWFVQDIAAPLAGTLAAAALAALVRHGWDAGSPSRLGLALFIAAGAALGVLFAACCCPEGRHWLRVALGLLRPRRPA